MDAVLQRDAERSAGTERRHRLHEQENAGKESVGRRGHESDDIDRSVSQAERSSGFGRRFPDRGSQPSASRQQRWIFRLRKSSGTERWLIS
jgi:hypothetical protein